MSEISDQLKQDDVKYIHRPWWFKGIVVAKAAGPYVTDVDGKTYLDCTASFFVMNLGHCHPEVVETIKEALKHYVHIPTYQSTPSAIGLAKKLASIVPVRGKDRKVFFSETGANSVEIAVRVARAYTGKTGIITFRGSYHGWNYGAGSLTTMKAFRQNPALPGVYNASSPYAFRCQYRDKCEKCDLTCLGDVKNILRDQSDDIAGILTEPIMASGGCIIPPPEWLQELRRICDEYGILLIADEVQTGFSRTGKMFGVEHFDVEPDVMALSKNVGGGIPIGAVVARNEVMEKFKTPVPSTFAGHPIACAAGLKTIEIMERERLWENALRLGDYLTERLTQLAARHSIIGDIRYKGLLGAIELVRDVEKKTPAVEEARQTVYRCMEQGVLMMAGGLYGSVLRIQPPLNISEEHVETIVESLDKAMAQGYSQAP